MNNPVSECTLVDMSSYKRRFFYDFFTEKDYPFFAATISLDITDLLRFVKKKDLPFFLTFTYCLQKAVNSIPEFKHRIVNDLLYEYDVVHPGFTVAQEERAFGFCDGIYAADYQNFLDVNIPRLDFVKKGGQSGGADRNSMFFISVAPWFSFTSVEHPRNSKNDTVPIFTIGKYEKENDIVKMPFAMHVHHGLMDGQHLAWLVENLISEMDNLCNAG